MSLTTTVAASDFDEFTSVWVTALHSVEDREWRTRWAGGNQVDAAGVGAVDIDARDLVTESGYLDPLDVIGSLTGHWDADLQTSDTTAGFSVLTVAYVYQADGAGTPNQIASHTLSFPASYVVEGATRDVTGYAVFSDKAVSITAERYTVGSVEYEVDAEFRAGWNVAYWGSNTDGERQFTAQPLAANTEFRSQPRNTVFATGEYPDVYGYSVFPTHALSEDPTPYVFAFYSTSRPAPSVYTRSWAGFHVTNNQLVPFSDAYPGLFTTAGVTVDPPEARGMVAAVFVYDETSVGGPGWASDLYSALGGAVFTNGAGQNVWFLYSDRAATLTVDVVNSSSEPIRTAAGGADMAAGWNRFDLVPDGVGGYVLTKVPLVAANWSFVM